MNRNLFFVAIVLSFIIAIVAYISFDSFDEERTTGETSMQVYGSYEGKTGPETWSLVDNQYEACGNGRAQSPININMTEIEQNGKMEEIQINYDSAIFSLINNGHTIKANETTNQNSIGIDGVEYKLKELHFHHPSEHQLNGISYDMEAHLVHQNDDGDLAVVGLFMREGDINAELATMWSILPKERTEREIALTEPINLVQLLPEEKNVFQYVGSLTTPPCTEGVQWIVLQQPINLSNEQITQFSDISSNNNRPIQSLNQRKIYEMDLE